MSGLLTPVPASGPLPPSEAALEAERRSFLGDSRSPDRLSGPQLQRFVEICGSLRALKRARGEVPARPGKAPRTKGVDIADL